MELIDFFSQKQSCDLTNLVSAHDVGLAHYWQAKKQSANAQAATHWQRVIANWAMVLESDAYWQAWCRERSLVYGRDITDEHIVSAKEKLREALVGEMAEATQRLAAATSHSHLEAAFFLESEAIRLLRKSGGLPLPEGGTVCCGPLQARQWSMESQVAAFFQQRPGFAGIRRDSLDVVLAVIPGDAGQPSATARFPGWQLQLCFSQLGIAWIYLERQRPQHTLDALGDIQCPACRLGRDSPADLAAHRGPVRCRDDCKDFDRLNPAYSAIADGRGLHCQHAVELAVSAHLALAYQVLNRTPADIESSLRHLHLALDSSERIGIRAALRQKLAERLLGWADGLGKAERLDEGVALLEGSAWLCEENDGRHQGKLAKLLNMRGVRSANGSQWAEAVADLRRACQLNIRVPYRDNLRNALQAYAGVCYASGDAERARALLDEAINLGRAPALANAPASAAPIPSPATEFIWKSNELANPLLFDEKGLLKLELFDSSGRTVLDQAQQEAAALGEAFLKPQALWLALTKVVDGEIIRLFGGLNSVPSPPQPPRPAGEERLEPVRRLSQFDFWPSARRILELALEIAQYDQGLIGERHLCYGFLVSGSVAERLRKQGLEAGQILERVVWD